MKILTIAIPSYNSMDYMRNCIESLLPGGEDVEILIVDDGSKDETPAIADEYEEKYPGIIRAIHQENGGHGEAVNAGLRNATGALTRSAVTLPLFCSISTTLWENRTSPPRSMISRRRFCSTTYNLSVPT